LFLLAFKPEPPFSGESMNTFKNNKNGE